MIIATHIKPGTTWVQQIVSLLPSTALSARYQAS
ncbi:MAG: hypothetical protein HOI95_02565 [Chromatiales bacterium]|nr:hypothetical protein [Chromatiales bacterium]